jgi:hypothetical protein
MGHGIKNGYYYSRRLLNEASNFTNTSFLDRERKQNLPCPFRVVDYSVGFHEPGSGEPSDAGGGSATLPLGHTCPMAEVNPSMYGSFCFYRARGDAPFQLAHWQSLDAQARENHFALPCASDACCNSLKVATGQCCGEESTLFEVSCMVGTVTRQSLEGNPGLGVAFFPDQENGDAFPTVQQKCQFAGASYSCPGTWLPEGDGHHGHPPRSALSEVRRTLIQNQTVEQHHRLRRDAKPSSVARDDGAMAFW